MASSGYLLKNADGSANLTGTRLNLRTITATDTATVFATRYNYVFELVFDII